MFFSKNLKTDALLEQAEQAQDIACEVRLRTELGTVWFASTDTSHAAVIVKVVVCWWYNRRAGD